MAEKPLVSAIILNYRNGRQTVACVRALQQQTIVDRMEIIVVENHSEDDSVGIIDNSTGENGIRVVETERNLGFGGGYNRGARYARGEYLLIDNPDKILEPSSVATLVSAMEADPTIGIIAPRLLHADGSQRLSTRRYPHVLDVLARRSVLGKLQPERLRQYLMLDVDMAQEQDVDWVVGGCFLIRRSLFEELGGFDERFFLFFEDTDLCRRCHDNGKRVVFLPSAIGHDKKRRLSGEHAWELLGSTIGRIHIASAIKYFWKWRKA